MRVVLTIGAASLALVACDGGGDPVQQALRETAAVNQSAAVKEGVTSPAGGHAPASQGAAASGGTADQAYIAGMIEHHRGAVAMADVALAQSQDADIRRMAQAVKNARTREIAEMRAWRPATTPGQ